MTIGKSCSCFEFITVQLCHCLSAFPGVEVHAITIDWRVAIDKDLVKKYDFILFIGYISNYASALELYPLTKKKKIITLSEFRDNNKDGWCFTFVKQYGINDRMTYVPSPCCKRLYRPNAKIPKTILIDHYWEPALNTLLDWSNSIQKWIAPLSKEYKIYRLVRFDGEDKTLLPHEIPIKTTYFDEYLESIRSMETFIVTHRESYGYGNIDNIALGTRVLAPPNFISRADFIDYFNLSTFSNEKELLRLITQPVDRKILDSNIDKCTDYGVVANMIHQKFLEFLEES